MTMHADVEKQQHVFEQEFSKKCKKTLLDSKKLVIVGKDGKDGKTTCAQWLFEQPEVSCSKDNIIIKSPSEHPFTADRGYGTILIDNVTSTSFEQWTEILQKANENAKYIIITCTTSTWKTLGFTGIKDFQFEFVEYEYTPEEREMLTVEIMFHFFIEKFLVLCAVSLLLGKNGTTTHDVRKKVDCLKNSTHFRNSDIHSIPNQTLIESMIQHGDYTSDNDIQSLQFPALQLLLSKDPGLVLDTIDIYTLIELGNLNNEEDSQLKHAYLLIPENYVRGLVYRISHYLAYAEADESLQCALRKSPLFRKKCFMKMIVYNICSNSNFYDVIFRHPLWSPTLKSLFEVDICTCLWCFVEWCKEENTPIKMSLEAAFRTLLSDKLLREKVACFISTLIQHKNFSGAKHLTSLLPHADWDFSEKSFFSFYAQQFPRFAYHVSLVCELTESVLGIGLLKQKELMWREYCSNIRNDPLIMVRGEVSKENLQLICKTRHRHEEVLSDTEYEGRLLKKCPLCIVCFLTHLSAADKEKYLELKESLETMYFKGATIPILLVISDEKQRTVIDEVFQYSNGVFTVTNEFEKVREGITSLLEDNLVQHIQLLEKSSPDSFKSKSQEGIQLNLRKNATMKRLNKGASRKNKTILKEKIVSKEMSMLLERYKDLVWSHGFWLETFKVYVRNNHRLHDEFMKDIEEIREEFSRPIKVVKVLDLKIDPHVKQGRKCFFEIGTGETHEDSYGTIGGFATQNSNGESLLVTISCAHLYQEGHRVFATLGGQHQQIGVCHRRVENRDISLARIDPSLEEQVDKILRNELDEPTSARILQDDDIIGEMVYKKGATSNWTQGVIISVQQYSNVLENKTQHAVLVKDLEGRFSLPGDSASFVIKRSDDPEQECIDVVAIVVGNLKTEHASGEQFLEEEEREIIFCENLQSAAKTLQQEGINISFFQHENDDAWST